MTVALIERKLVGGTCANTGCMPIKMLVASADAGRIRIGSSARGQASHHFLNRSFAQRGNTLIEKMSH
jgi:pyruvate/2-oxoglutarate dehydrogenase complex dihydrolipoamide dehydrogenase (E3) component